MYMYIQQCRITAILKVETGIIANDNICDNVCRGLQN